MPGGGAPSLKQGAGLTYRADPGARVDNQVPGTSDSSGQLADLPLQLLWVVTHLTGPELVIRPQPAARSAQPSTGCPRLASSWRRLRPSRRRLRPCSSVTRSSLSARSRPSSALRSAAVFLRMRDTYGRAEGERPRAPARARARQGLTWRRRSRCCSSRSLRTRSAALRSERLRPPPAAIAPLTALPASASASSGSYRDACARPALPTPSGSPFPPWSLSCSFGFQRNTSRSL